MKISLFDFQEDALENLRKKIKGARQLSSMDNPQVISFSAPTGSGKTIVMTALFEDIFLGEPEFESQPDAIVLWISDMPELNEQTRRKIESKSDHFKVSQLITIDASFDKEYLSKGHIYFMNTQKLGSEKILTRKGDDRQYTIWETLTNTAQIMPDRFYVVIDEAHRGMQEGKAKEAQTIMQKFLLGSGEDGLCRMPLVIGVSATPRRFEELIANTTHTLHKVYIEAEEVRKSGLLKDRILIHFPDMNSQAEMSLLSESANRWQRMRRSWSQYSKSQNEEIVDPILVIQVADGTDKILTRTDLSAILATIENAIGRRLRNGEIAHTFNDIGDLDVDGRKVRRIEASRIQEEQNLGVVIFKMSLSTGWDCPRAEVMMSFRRAQDHTYIAQLLGRMVRTPLARRIESNASLNDVHLFLPHYDQNAVEAVIQDLKNIEDVPPAETGTSRNLVTLHRRPGSVMDKVFEAFRELVTYRVNAVRKQSAIRRLMGLARGLNHDQIDITSQEKVTKQLIGKMAAQIRQFQNQGILSDKTKIIKGFNIETIAIEHGNGTFQEGWKEYIEAASSDIERHFQQAGRLLGNGLHMDYWRAQGHRNADEVKVEVILLAQDPVFMQELEIFAESEFSSLYEEHKQDIGDLKEKRRQHYEKLRIASAEPQDIPWYLPESIAFSRSTNAPEYDKHIFLEHDDKFRADLGTWEQGVLMEELEDPSVIGWLRNLDRKPWSLEIPYGEIGNMSSMFPDIIVVRKEVNGFLFDILEPHNPSLKDNVGKAKGLARFAEKHWNLFDRIQLIRKMKASDGKDHYFRLDLGKDCTRKKVLSVNSDERLDEIFKEEASLKV